MCPRTNNSAAPQAGPGCFDEDRGIAGRTLVNRRGSAADCVGGLQRDCRDPRVIVIYPAPCIASLGLKEIGWTPVGCQHVPLDQFSSKMSAQLRTCVEKPGASNQSAESAPPISEIAAEMIFGESRQLQLNGGLVAHRPGRAGAVGKYRHLTTHPRHQLC
jgi:hypothetical protein